MKSESIKHSNSADHQQAKVGREPWKKKIIESFVPTEQDSILFAGKNQS